MDFNELEANGNSVKFNNQKKENNLGGILKRGSLAWLAEESTLQIVSLKNGQLISSYTFPRSIYNCNIIVCVTELRISSHDVILAVCLDYIPNSSENVDSRSSIAIYSVEYGCVLNWMKLELYVTCMCFLPPKNCRRSLIQHFDGCLAVGTQEGLILTIDLYLNYLIEIQKEKQKQCLNTQTVPPSCCIVDYNLPLVELHRTYKRILRERSMQNIRHFGVQLEVIGAPCSIETLLPIDVINGLASGLEDGRLVIHDMSDTQIIYASEDHEQGALLKMDFLEPTDDPRACFYILTIHGNGNFILNSLFSFMYEKRTTDEHGNIFFEHFQNGVVKLEMLVESSRTATITCQAVTRPPKNTEDDAICLFAVSWSSLSNGKTKLLVFDINQWYKEEMPNDLVENQAKSCLATFITTAHQCGLDSFLNPATISHFNSIQRCEEHFYPNSLSFDWLVLDANNGHHFNWPGIQNKALNILRASTASLFLEPDIVFERIREARLLPQFTELNANAVFSQNAKNEALLSAALENNCTGLLRDCIRSWADGSFSGPNIILSSYYGAELTTQTFKKWIFKRASAVKKRCDELCEELLNNNGHPLDQREKKELGFITRQLKLLADLYDDIAQLNTSRMLEKEKDESLRLASDYQELLTWLINIGLLPESRQQFCNDDIPTISSLTSTFVSIYPYRKLHDYYIQRRLEIAKVDEGYISKKSGSCRLLFIDAFIEHECIGNSRISGTTQNDNLREYWVQNAGNGLYPPTNIASMLRVMLLKNVDYDSKCAIFFYFFFDLHIALTDGATDVEGDLKEIIESLQKFSNVFKLSQSLQRFLQAFWYLDHGIIVAAVDEILSPFNKEQKVEQWLVELMVESLLLQNGSHLALRILDAYSNLISPSLKLSILLANNMIGEAFHFVRFKNDTELMRHFFTNCLRMGNLGVIRDFALNEQEGKLVENLLRKTQLPGAANLHFVYLLQKSKYIEAVSYLDELSKEKDKEKNVRFASITNRDTETDINDTIDTPNLVLSAFNTTTAPVTKSLTDVYFRIKDRIKQKETQNRAPVPLSCQLIKQNANNLLGGIYHSSALSAHFATCYYDEELQYGKQSNCENVRSNVIRPLAANNAPFLRKPQTETCRNAIDTFDRQTLCYPQPYQLKEKRRINELDQEDNTVVDNNGVGVRNMQQQKTQPPNKKRRMQAEDFTNGFKHFQKKNIILSEHGLDLTEQLNVSALAQPLATKQTSGILYQEIENTNTNSLKGNELHSILKSNTPEPNDIRFRRGATPIIEEKTLRFTLPSELMPVHPSEVTPQFEVKHRVVTRSISEESSHTEDVDMTKYDSALTTQASRIELTKFEELETNSIKIKKPSKASDTVIKQTVEENTPEYEVKHRVVTRTISQELPPTEDVEMTQYYSALSTQPSKTESKRFDELKTNSNKDSGISITAKKIDVPAPSVLLYQTERSKSLSPKMSGPKPRKPIERHSVEPQPLSHNITSQHKESISKITSDHFAKEGSSGLGSTVNKESENQFNSEISKSDVLKILKMTSVTTLSSVDFKPQICSSKIGENQAKLLLEQQQQKMSERSTVFMTSDIDLHEVEKSESKSGFPQSRAALASIDELESFDEIIEKEKKEQLDTTLGMSSYDITDFNATAVDTANEQESRNSLEIAEEDSTNESEDQQYEVDQNEESSPSSNVIELLSTTDENNSGSNENSPEYDDTEGTSYSEVTSDNTNSNFAPSNLETSVSLPVIELVDDDDDDEEEEEEEEEEDEEENDDDDDDDDDNEEGTIGDTSDEVVSPQETELSSRIVEQEVVAEVESQNVPEILIEDITESDQMVEASIPVTEEELKESIESIGKLQEQPERAKECNEIKTPDGLPEIDATEKLQVSFGDVESTDAPTSLTDLTVDENASAVLTKSVENEQVQSNEAVEKKENQVITEAVGNDQEKSSEEVKPEETLLETKDESNKKTEKPEKPSGMKNEISLITVPVETTADVDEIEVSFAENKIPPMDSSAIENSEKDNIDTSDHFETPNTSLQLVQELEEDISKNNSNVVETSHSDLLQAVDSTKKYGYNTRKRGQSVPPQSLILNEIEHLEYDPNTPKKRNKRGISVPPQTVDTPTLTPTTRKRASTRGTEGKTKSVNEGSPQSTTSSRSDRESIQKALHLGSAGSPVLDSPALRTRSRMRTISGNSDATENSINSPAVSAKKSRRSSISSNISEQLPSSLTPKRTRRQSISSRSDAERIPLSKRVLLKEVEEEPEEQNEESTADQKRAEAGMDIYSSTRRMTRTQRAILEKSEQISAAMESAKEDHQSTPSPTFNQIVTRSKTARSVKSNDDGDDDRASVASSTASETRRTRRLRALQHHSPNANLTSIPENDVIGDVESISKQHKTAKK